MSEFGVLETDNMLHASATAVADTIENLFLRTKFLACLCHPWLHPDKIWQSDTPLACYRVSDIHVKRKKANAWSFDNGAISREAILDQIQREHAEKAARTDALPLLVGAEVGPHTSAADEVVVTRDAPRSSVGQKLDEL